jgi:hypothetical protein
MAVTNGATPISARVTRALTVPENESETRVASKPDLRAIMTKGV